MNALTHDFAISHEVPPPRELVPGPQLEGGVEGCWERVHAMADAIGRLGQLGKERPSAEIAAFPANLAQAPEWRAGLATRALADLEAVLRPGTQALVTIEAEGRDPVAAAVALWQEFYRARQGILDLVLPDDLLAS